MSSGTRVETLVEDQFLSANIEEIRRMQEESRRRNEKTEIVWRNVALFFALHVGALIGLVQLIGYSRWLTVFWVFVLHVLGSMGVTGGAHRLWAHRSYKARFPMRVFLMLINSIAFQNDIIEWARDHRCHHKWTDTDADPHSTNRGMFFAHMGWLLVKKRTQLKVQGAKLDLSDLTSDPVLMFQRKNYLPLVGIFCFAIPTFVPVYFWGESPLIAFYTAALFRYCFTLHATWCINSVSHWIGWKAYDVDASSVDNLWTSVAAVGEGGHNFHHTFPQDYRTSEHTEYLNWTRVLIDTAADWGLVYDRKTTSEAAIARQCAKHGDEGARQDLLKHLG
uniref:FA_desaturase domain-containing protein n=1 Tax=Caenorhabditis tropicalis TaxID=1561998 RepID=A0A1I7TRK8_9PELO